MEYVGIQSQIWKNNTRSTLLLISFPLQLVLLTWAFFLILYQQSREPFDMDLVNESFLQSVPFVLIAVGIWFLIAWAGHGSMIKKATGSKSLERKENMRVYNLVENLCMSRGIKTPKIYVIEDDSLNAFASGITERSYAISLSRGIINKLNDEELEGVIAHELTHIMNRDVRLLIVSVIFVGIFAFLAQIAFRMLLYGGRGRDRKGSPVLVIVLILAVIGYGMSLVTRFALSRKREYMADAGAVELTKNSKALASALRKISADPVIEVVKRDDVAQMFIEHPKTHTKNSFASFLSGIFATHPPIEKRIEILEQF